MKNTMLALFLVLMVAVLLSGCGKSEELKKIEATLNTEVMQKHDDLMKSVTTLDELTAQIDAAMAKHDELVKKYPKQTADHKAGDLMTAKDRIVAAKAKMEKWMNGFKPYNMAAKHEEVMAGLTKSKDELIAMQEQFNAAMTFTKDAIASHTKMAEELMAKMPKHK
jgi:predicted  nucleic acid-binding Zn-ribbon protein